MKDYLQLDGMCYKLIPIKTEVDESNPYEMGMVDSQKMLSIVKNWEWASFATTRGKKGTWPVSLRPGAKKRHRASLATPTAAKDIVLNNLGSLLISLQAIITTLN